MVDGRVSTGQSSHGRRRQRAVFGLRRQGMLCGPSPLYSRPRSRLFKVDCVKSSVSIYLRQNKTFHDVSGSSL